MCFSLSGAGPGKARPLALESQCISLRVAQFVSACLEKRPRQRGDVPIVRVVFLTKVCGQEERWGTWCHDAISWGQGALSEHTAGTQHSQSMNPFHADTDALRAVSTVPPMTTSFCVARARQHAEVRGRRA